MKKLFVLAIAIGMSLVVGASTVTWGAASATAIDSTKIATGTFYLMYASTAFDASKLTGESFSASTLAAAGLDKTFDTFEYSASNYKKQNKAITPTSTGVASGTVTIYEVLISSDGKNLVYGQSSMSLAASAGMNQNKVLSSSALTYVAAGGGSQGDIPEPTSGLLLLVGAGMLALRRKQK